MNTKLFSRHSLKTRVTLFTLAIFLVSLWSLGSYASLKLRHDMQHQLGEGQSSTVSFIAEEINHQIDERFRTLEKVAANVAPATLANSAALQRFLEQQREDLQGPFNAGVVVYGLDGTVIADVPVSAAWFGVNFLNREFLLAALKQGRSTIGQSVLGNKPGAPVVVIVTPIRDGRGKVIGALAGITNLELPNFLDIVSQNGPGKTGGYLLIAPQQRQIIVATDKRQVMHTLPGSATNEK